MKVRERAAQLAVQIASDDSYGYCNQYPNNQWWRGKDMDCGSFCSFAYYLALKEAGIDIGQVYYEPCGGSEPVDCGILKYFDKLDYQTERNAVGDLLVSTGHTVMVTALGVDWYADTITHASDDYDGKSGDSTGQEICSRTLWDNGWYAIYRLKDCYNKEIGSEPQPTPSGTYSVTYAAYDNSCGVLPAVDNDDDYAGYQGDMGAFTCSFKDGLHNYFAHVMGQGWFEGVSGYDPSFANTDKYAGEKGLALDFVAIQGAGYKYRVQIQHSYWLPWVYSKDCNLDNYDSGCAGDGNGEITGIQICPE